MLRVRRATRTRKPPNFMLPMQVFSNDVLGLRATDIYMLLLTELECKAKGATWDGGSLKPCPETDTAAELTPCVCRVMPGYLSQALRHGNTFL